MKQCNGNGSACAGFMRSQWSAAENEFDSQYRRVLNTSLQHGDHADTSRRPCKCIYGENLCINAQSQAPFLTLQRLAMKKIIVEALWYMRGEPHVLWLRSHNVYWWDAEADDAGFIGLNYGLMTVYPGVEQKAINQLEEVINTLIMGRESMSSPS